MSAADLMAVLLAKHLHYDFGRPGRPSQRPPDLLQGTRLAALLQPPEGRRCDHRRGAADVPAARKSLRGPPDAGAAVGRRGHRLARPGAADRRRRRARRQAPRSAALPGLGSVRRQRDGRGIDLGGVRARRIQRARQPDRDHRRQPARSDAPDDARLGSRLLRRTRTRLRLARDRDRRPRRRGDRRRVRRGARTSKAARP